MKFLFFLLLVNVFIAGLPCRAISRIGGGRIKSQSSHFTARLSPWYQSVKTGNRKIHLFSYVLDDRGPTSDSSQEKIFLAEFKSIFPSLISLSRQETIQYYFGLGFKTLRTDFALNPCVEIFYKEADTTNQYVLTWGSGRGFQMNLTYDKRTQQEGLRLIESVALERGACAWK